MKLSSLPYPDPIVAVPQFDTLDSTKVNEFQTCPRKFFYRYILGWESEHANIHFVFGSAIHEAMEVIHKAMQNGNLQLPEVPQLAAHVFWKRFAEELDPEAGIYKKKEPSEGVRAINNYWEHYRAIDTFDVLHIEVPGDVFIAEDKILTVKIDTICEDERGKFVLEHKTASAESQVWKDQWMTAIQPKAYTHVLYSIYDEEEVYGTIINGIIMRKDIGFVRVPVKDTPDAMADWLWQMEYKFEEIEHNCKALCECSKDDHIMQAFPKREISCTSYMSTCVYMPYCTAWRNPLKHADSPPPGTKIRHWDPKAEFAGKGEVFDGEKIVKETSVGT